MSPFDYLNSINDGPRGKRLDVSDYVPFMINRGMSYHRDTVLLANEMNRHASLDHQLQYDFLKSATRPKRRFAKWHKAPKPSEDIKLIQIEYKYSREKAEAVYELFTKQQLKELRKKYGSLELNI